MKLVALLLVGARAGISPKTKSAQCPIYFASVRAGGKQRTITDAATAQDRLLDRRRHLVTDGHQPDGYGIGRSAFR